MATVRAEKIYKVFGRHAQEAVTDLEKGESPETLRDRGQTAAVIDASFEVREGEIFVVMGLSGSGKSTLIRTLNGLLPPTSGAVYVDEQNITEMAAKDLRSVRQNTMSMVFQHFALFPHRTIGENAAYGLRVRGLDKAERTRRAYESLEMVGLKGWENHYPSQLSGGMQQRVGLARALAADTNVLLMDEAFSALDPLIRRDMQNQLIELQRKLAKTIIFITHDLNEAMRLGDHIAMMRGGRIVQIGTAKQILDEPADDYVAEFVQDVDRSRVLTAGAVAEELPTVQAASDARTALDLMRSRGLPEAFVISGGRFVGTLSQHDLAQAINRGAATIDSSVNRRVPTTTPETPIVELLPVAANTETPLAVLGPDNNLVGGISRNTLLHALGPQGKAPPPTDGEQSGINQRAVAEVADA